MLEEQLDLFPEGRPGRVALRAGTRPIAWVPTDLDAGSSLAAAITGFHGLMIRPGFSDNTIKSFQADLRLFSKYVAADQPGPSAASARPIWSNFSPGCTPMHKVSCSPKSSTRRLTTLKVFFGWLNESEAVPSNPAAPIRA